MGEGDAVEVFDSAGRRGMGVLRPCGEGVAVQVGEVVESARTATGVVRVASAVPKGDRADWLVEKLAELGVAEWWPVETRRSVVVPKGVSKRQRWERIAQEAARQSGAGGVLRVGELRTLQAALAELASEGGVYGTTGPGARPAAELTAAEVRGGWVLIGPEGGWSPEEVGAMDAAGLVAVSLGPTVLRVETACVVGAAAVGWAMHRSPPPP